MHALLLPVNVLKINYSSIITLNETAFFQNYSKMYVKSTKTRFALFFINCVYCRSLIIKLDTS